MKRKNVWCIADRLDELGNRIETLSYAIEDANVRAERLRLARQLGKLGDELLTIALELRETDRTTPEVPQAAP